MGASAAARAATAPVTLESAHFRAWLETRSLTVVKFGTASGLATVRNGKNYNQSLRESAMSFTRKTARLRPFKHTALATAIAPLCASMSTVVMAQEPVEEVLVTGSYIKSTSTDQASPVSVINNEYISNSGAFTVGELTGKLSVNSGSENQADSFTSGETQGTSNVNLRGLGLSSTLVLVNGRRQTIAATRANDGSVFVDTGTIPIAALERVEILKEGATSAYGSDAVAGVVNYILKTGFEGFEVNAGYQSTAEDSQDTTEASFLAGFGNDTTNFTFAAAIMRQDPLSSSDRPETVDNAVSTLGRSFILEFLVFFL